MITFYFHNGSEITIRSSGTEPKIKLYSEIKKKRSENEQNSTSNDDELFRKQTKKELNQLVEQIIEEFLQPDKNGLIRRETTPK